MNKGPAKKKQGGFLRGIHKYGTAYLLIAPPLLSILIFLVGPMLVSLYWSFTDYSGISAPVWIGLKNYHDLLFKDKIFGQAMWNTVAFVLIGEGAGPVLGMLTALMLNQDVKGRSFFRTCYFLPQMTSFVVISTVWKMLYSGNGLFNELLGFLGAAPVNWLGDPNHALLSVAIASIWQGFGFETVLFLAALQGVPKELHEAAMMDGAGPLRRFFAVTLPALKPVVVYAYIVGVIGSFQLYDQVYVMTYGGPMHSTTSIVLYLFTKFRDLRLGYASAISYILFVILVLLSWLQWRLFGKEEEA